MANTHAYLLYRANIAYPNTLSLEPSMQDINKMKSNLEKKSTELFMILMDIKLLTTKYVKDKNQKEPNL